MLMAMMMGGNAIFGSPDAIAEQQQLQRVLEESKRDNPDNMTYE
jgi:hypothetical protein